MAVDITTLSDEELSKKIKSAEVAVERNTGLIKEASERKLAKLKAELESRTKDVKKDVEKVEKKVEKKAEEVKKDVKKVAKKVEKTVEKEVEKVEKPAAEKKPRKKKPRVYGSPTEKFELTIDGKVYKFADLASKEACEKATAAVAARYKEVKEHRASTKAGIERASTIPVTKRISDSFVSIAKKAVSEVPKTKIDKNPEDIKKELDAVEKAFDNLFDKLGALMGKEIPKAQRKQIMDILTKFEAKVDKGGDKKAVATSKVRKEDGGLAGIESVSGDGFGADNPFSYASFM